MKTVFLILILISILTAACNSNNGKYVVYKTDLGSYPNDLDRQLADKYNKDQYILDFADKYVKVSVAGTKEAIILGRIGEQTPGTTYYRTESVEGSDSVTVGYELEVGSENIILDVSASRKNFHSTWGTPEANAKLFLAKAVTP